MDQPHNGASRGGGLFGPLLVVLGLLAGGGVSVGLLLWWEQNRRETAERERVESLGRPDKRPKPAKDREVPADPKDPLAQANDQFREIYRLVRAEAVAHADPVVVVSGDDLILIHKGERQSIAVVPKIYHELKAYAHVPLATYLVVGVDSARVTRPEPRTAEMRKLLARIPELREDLKNREFSAEVRRRQERLLDESAKLLESCLKKTPDANKLRDQFAANLRAPIQANVREAARAQITGLDKQMSKWRADLSDAEWKQLKVIVIGSAMPRRSNLAVQYFAWLLKESPEESKTKRIIYAESLFEEQKALNLLGTHIVDEGIGRSFFGEPTRMKRDLLGDDAAEILEEMSRARPDR